MSFADAITSDLPYQKNSFFTLALTERRDAAGVAVIGTVARLADGVLGALAAVLTLPQAMSEAVGFSLINSEITAYSGRVSQSAYLAMRSAVGHLSSAANLPSKLFGALIHAVNPAAKDSKPAEACDLDYTQPAKIAVIKKAQYAECFFEREIVSRLAALGYTLAAVLKYAVELVYGAVALPFSPLSHDATRYASRGLEALNVIPALFEGIIGIINPHLFANHALEQNEHILESNNSYTYTPPP